MLAKDRTALAEKMKDAVDRLVSYEGNFPKTNDSKESVAGEYYLIHELAKLVDARKKAISKKAILHGVIRDKDKYPLGPGLSNVEFDGTHVLVTLNVNQPSSRLDQQELRLQLIKSKVAAKVVDKAFDAATTATAPAHLFKAMIRED